MAENNMNNEQEVEEGSSVIEVVMRGSSSESGSGSSELEGSGKDEGQTSQSGTYITVKLKVSTYSDFDLQLINCKIGKISGNAIYNIMSNAGDSDYTARYTNNIGSFDNYTGVVTLQGYSYDDIVTTIENNSNYLIIFYAGYTGFSMYCEQCFVVSGLQLKGTNAITSSNIRNSSEYSNYTWYRTQGGQQ